MFYLAVVIYDDHSLYIWDICDVHKVLCKINIALLAFVADNLPIYNSLSQCFVHM